MNPRFLSLFILLLTLVLLAACSPAKAAKQDAQPAKPATLVPTIEQLPASTATKEPAPTATKTPSSTEIIKERVIWKFQTAGAIWGSPLVSNGMVYIGSDDGKLYAVSAASGEKKWDFTTGGVVRSQPTIDASQGSGVLYFTSDDGYFYALDAGDGVQIWRTDIGNVTEVSVRANVGNSPDPSGYDYVQSSPLLLDGRIYIGSADGKVYALKAATGDVLWTYQTGAQVRATPTLVDGVVYVGSWDYSMYALDAQTGELLWQTPIGGQIQTTALVSDNLVYSASRKASVLALNIETGELRWEYSYGGNMWVESSPTLVGSTLFIGSSGSQVILGIDAKTGKRLIGYVTGQFCWSRPLIVDQTLIMGCTNTNRLYQGLFVLAIGADKTQDGQQGLTPLWQLPMAKGLEHSGEWYGAASSGVFAEGVIYFGGLDGSLYAVKK